MANFPLTQTSGCYLAGTPAAAMHDDGNISLVTSLRNFNESKLIRLARNKSCMFKDLDVCILQNLRQGLITKTTSNGKDLHKLPCKSKPHLDQSLTIWVHTPQTWCSLTPSVAAELAREDNSKSVMQVHAQSLLHPCFESLSWFSLALLFLNTTKWRHLSSFGSQLCLWAKHCAEATLEELSHLALGASNWSEEGWAA